jgi:hypothetical protein
MEIGVCALCVIVSARCRPRNRISMSTATEPAPAMGKRKNRAYRLSKDSPGRSFPHVPHWLPYLNSRTYFARINRQSKIIRECCSFQNIMAG